MKKTIQFTLLFTFALAVFGGCVSDNGKFPQPTANFTPKQTYAVAYDKLWSGILDALDKNRITTVSVDKASGVIQTDYIAGPGEFMVFAAQSTRYKYNLTVRNQADGTVKLNIICKVEDSMNGSNGSSQWRDVTPQNLALTTKLETWLYEQIEPEIK
jgi:NlpB/DapX lipoprotein